MLFLTIILVLTVVWIIADPKGFLKFIVEIFSFIAIGLVVALFMVAILSLF